VPVPRWLARAAQQVQQASDSLRTAGGALRERGAQLGAEVGAKVTDALSAGGAGTAAARIGPRTADAYEVVLRRLTERLALPGGTPGPVGPARPGPSGPGSDVAAPASNMVGPGSHVVGPGSHVVGPGPAGSDMDGPRETGSDMAGSQVVGSQVVGSDLAAADGPGAVSSARLATRLTALVSATDWAAVSQRAGAHKDEVAIRARELLRHVDWGTAGPQATRLAVALAIGAAAGSYDSAVDEGAELVSLLLSGHRAAVAASAEVAAQLDSAPAGDPAAALLDSPAAQSIRHSLTDGSVTG
jgi:hypothetical protein